MRPLLLASATALCPRAPPRRRARRDHRRTSPSSTARPTTARPRPRSPAPTSRATPRQPCPASGVPTCTYEAHEFTIAPGEDNGAFAVTITWARRSDEDWDLFVYRSAADGIGRRERPRRQLGAGRHDRGDRAAPREPGRADRAGHLPDLRRQLGRGDARLGGLRRLRAVRRRPTSGPSPSSPRPRGRRAGSSSPSTPSGSTDPDGTIDQLRLGPRRRRALRGRRRQRRSSSTSSRPGRAHVSVRVRDNEGGVDYATRTITHPARVGGQTTATVPPPPGSITLRRPRAGSGWRRPARAASPRRSAARPRAGSPRRSASTARRPRGSGSGRKPRTIAARARGRSAANARRRAPAQADRRGRCAACAGAPARSVPVAG